MSEKQWDSPPEMQIDVNKTYKIEMDTSKGLIELELYPEHAPKTVNNFVFLAREGFYDNVSFHRVIANFVIQGGDPTGTGRGGPGYRFEDELEGNPLTHERGVISMANAGPNTNGSQFFITYDATPQLNEGFTIIGRVISGMNVAESLQPRDPQQNPDALPGDKIINITIEEKG